MCSLLLRPPPCVAPVLAVAGLLALGGCRPRLAPLPEAPTLAPASPTAAGVAVCWVESRANLGFTASSLLVRHPRGDLLIDAGNSSDFSREIEPYSGADHRWLATFPGALKPRQPLGERLAAMGVDPAGLHAVLPTHAHLDHLGGVLDLPPTPVWVSPAEAAIIERGRSELLFEVIPAHAKVVADRMQTIDFVPEPYSVFDRHADLFGDGSVVAVPLFGHTPGSVGVFVRLEDGRRVLHVGDAVNDRLQIEHLRGRASFMRRTDTDPETANEVVARLHALAQADPGLVFLPAHERDAWKDAFGHPDERCPAA